MTDTTLKDEKFFDKLNDDKTISQKDKIIIGEIYREEGLVKANKAIKELKNLEEIPTSSTVFISKPEEKPPVPKMLGGRVYAPRKANVL